MLADLTSHQLHSLLRIFPVREKYDFLIGLEHTQYECVATDDSHEPGVALSERRTASLLHALSIPYHLTEVTASTRAVLLARLAESVYEEPVSYGWAILCAVVWVVIAPFLFYHYLPFFVSWYISPAVNICTHPWIFYSLVGILSLANINYTGIGLGAYAYHRALFVDRFFFDAVKRAIAAAAAANLGAVCHCLQCSYVRGLPQ